MLQCSFLNFNFITWFFCSFFKTNLCANLLMNKETMDYYGPFPLRAWNKAFFVCFIIFFYFFPRLSAKRSKKQNKKYSIPRSKQALILRSSVACFRNLASPKVLKTASNKYKPFFKERSDLCDRAS